MMQIVPPLLLVNLALFIAIGLIRQANPFEVWIGFLLAIGNVVTLAAAALLTHGNSMHALSSFASNLFPLFFVACGVALLLFVMTDRSPKRHTRS